MCNCNSSVVSGSSFSSLSLVFTPKFSAVKVSSGAIADALVDRDEFKKFTGFNLSEVTAMKEGALVTLPPGFETKVYGIGEPSPPEITAVSRSLGKKEGDAITEAMGIQTQPGTIKLGKVQGLYGQNAIDMLFTKGFKGVREQLFLNARVKFANLLIVDMVDIEKQGKEIFKFITDPLGNLEKDVFTKAAKLEKYFSIAIKLKEASKATVADKWRISITPKAQLYTDMKKNVRDITDKVKKAHLETFSQKLLNYLVLQELPEKIKEKDINGYFELIIGFAKEFERGGMTPFVLRSEIVRQMPTPINTLLNVKTKKRRGKKAVPQKFISGAQITALVRNRLRKLMPQGPRRGPPLSPTIMTNRTGRFRRSIEVIPHYRTNMMKYIYDPLYMSLLDTPYNPDILISSTIREVVQKLFSRQFAVMRGM